MSVSEERKSRDSGSLDPRRSFLWDEAKMWLDGGNMPEIADAVQGILLCSLHIPSIFINT